jgi:hypothetical protein
MAFHIKIFVILMVIVLFASSLLMAPAVTGSTACGATRQVTLIVDPAGSDGVKKVQWALDNATDGDTILVYPGTYHESIVIDKEVIIKGGRERQDLHRRRGRRCRHIREPYRGQGVRAQHKQCILWGPCLEGKCQAVRLRGQWKCHRHQLVNGRRMLVDILYQRGQQRRGACPQQLREQHLHGLPF